MHIGSVAPTFRAPAVAPQVGFVYLDSRSLVGRSRTLTFLPRLGLGDVFQLNTQADDLRLRTDALLLVLPEPMFQASCWLATLARPPLVLLADPCRRLARAYGVPLEAPVGRCHSFVLDDRGLLRFHLVHDLNPRGVGALLEMLALPQTLNPA